MGSNVRETTIDNIAIGDVYYKRNAYDGWHGPAKVILIDKKIATVRHGGATLRVHAVSLRRAPEANNEDTVVNSRNVQKGAGNLQMKQVLQKELKCHKMV